MSLSKTDYKYFFKARQAASISDFHKTYIGCVAVYQGNIIGIGCNLEKTHPIQNYYNRYRNLYNESNFIPKIHAEISCLNSICHLDIMDINFSKVKLYIYRVRRDQDYGLLRPCPSCMAAIKDLGIRDVYYTTNEGFAYEKIIIDEKG